MSIALQEAVPNCPLCGAASSSLFDHRNQLGFDLINRVCQSCGLVFLSPRMSAGQLAQFYAQDYRTLYHNAKEPTQSDVKVQTQRANYMISLAKGLGIIQLDSHLDIGCSTGILLSAFQAEYKSQPYGIELDDAHRTYAREHGINAFTNLTELPGTLEGQFGLISLVHVLEHMPDPVGTLTELRRRWIQPDGWLLLEVPNLYCHDSFEVAHLVSFSAATLTRTVQQAGFKVTKILKHGHPRSDILPLYITLIARPGGLPTSHLQPEREFAVRVKRQAGLANRRLLTRLLPGKAWKPG